MPRNVRNTASQIGEDVTDKAGWMYADLFLALMVIFLATISFVPEFRSAPTAAKSDGTTSIATSTMDQGGTLQYSSFDPERLKADVAAYKKEKGLSTTAEIIYVQVIGGFTAPKEGINAGTMTAVEFSLKMKQQLPELFNTASFKLDATQDLPSNTVSLRFVFAG